MRIHSRNDLHLVINDRGYRRGVEVGVEKGEYTEYLLKNTEAFIFGVDSWQYIQGYNDIANISDEQHRANMDQAFERLSPYIKENRCQLMRLFSIDAATRFGDGSLDFVYIDANHTFEEAKSDMAVWDSKVRMGGMIAGHDFLDGLYLVDNELSEFGVMSAVYDYLKDKHYRLEVTNSDTWPTWYIVKE